VAPRPRRPVHRPLPARGHADRPPCRPAAMHRERRIHLPGRPLTRAPFRLAVPPGHERRSWRTETLPPDVLTETLFPLAGGHERDANGAGISASARNALSKSPPGATSALGLDLRWYGLSQRRQQDAAVGSRRVHLGIPARSPEPRRSVDRLSVGLVAWLGERQGRECHYSRISRSREGCRRNRRPPARCQRQSRLRSRCRKYRQARGSWGAG